MKVQSYNIGYGPKILSFNDSENTEFALRAFPLGMFYAYVWISIYECVTFMCLLTVVMLYKLLSFNDSDNTEFALRAFPFRFVRVHMCHLCVCICICFIHLYIIITYIY